MRDPKVGQVYLLRMDGSNFYKVGFTSMSIEKRIKELQTACPRKLHLITYFLSNTLQEKLIHESFSEVGKTTDGGSEWVEIEEEDVNQLLHKFTVTETSKNNFSSIKMRQIKVSGFDSEAIDAVYDGEIIEIVSNRKTKAVLIRAPKTEEQWERLCQLAEEITRKK